MTITDRMAWEDYKELKVLRNAGFTIEESAEWLDKDPNYLRNLEKYFIG